MLRFLVIILVLAGCADRGVTVLQPQAAQVGTLHRVHVATTRAPDGSGWFGADRAGDRRFLALDVSVPPAHRAGRISAGYARPDPAQDFTMAARRDLEGAAGFRSSLGADLSARPRADRDVVLYVHGYNNSFLDGVYRSAQLMHDFDLPGAAAHFAWASAAHPLGYTYDRDSLLIARDALEQTLYDLRAAGAGRIVIVAHSLGGMLTMETLRQIDIADPGWSERHLGGVILISPDLDIALFRTQMAQLRGVPQPFAIFVSQKDRVLALSALINGVGNRLGNLADPADLADFPVTVVDVTDFNSTADGHFTAGTSPLLIGLLSRSAALGDAFAFDRAGRAGLLSGTVLTVRQATTVILSPDLLNRRP